MKVLFCHDGPLRRDDFNNYYGVAHNNKTFQRYYNIAENLTVAIRVNEISSEEGAELFSRITVRPFEVVQIPNISSFAGSLTNKREVKKKIKNAISETDYVVVRLPSFTGFIAFDFAKKLGKPCLVELVACPWDAFWNHSLRGKLLAPHMYYATKKRVLNASNVVYVTNEFLQRRYPTRGKQINCSNVSLIKTEENVLENRLLKISRMNNHKKTVLGTTAAVNVRYKGQQYIIEALGKLKKLGYVNYEYQLVGGGNQDFLKSIAEKFNVSDQVVFLGSLPHSEVFSWLDTIDIYSQPSRQEGLPRSLVEAMSRALPAIGAKTAGIPELLDESCIFTNSKHNIGEIVSILLSLNKDNLVNQASKNFNEAKKYKEEIIEKKREEFFGDFRDLR